jgi:hypothetical protein
MVTVTNSGENMEDHGEDWRIERYFQSEPDGTHHWGVYERVRTGAINPEILPGGRMTAQTSGVHPVLGVPTNEEFVWVKRFAGTEEAVREFVAERTR